MPLQATKASHSAYLLVLFPGGLVLLVVLWLVLILHREKEVHHKSLLRHEQRVSWVADHVIQMILNKIKGNEKNDTNVCSYNRH